ncbi:MAG TPA: hypothetical protein EYQ69_03655 [Gemmatimonadetes bacterium]|nr:hypothetical protein [Gemmatimonadota bacterium]
MRDKQFKLPLIPSTKVGLICCFLLAMGFSSLLGQDSSAVPESNQLPRIFFDCEGRTCRLGNELRIQIPWVTWVRDQSDADLHVIATSSTTGSGGTGMQVDYIGLGSFSDYLDQMQFFTSPTDTSREWTDSGVHTLGIGLARFADVAGYRGIVSLIGATGNESLASERVVSREEVEDPWNLWVFRLNTSGDFDGESSRETLRTNGSFNASKVTPTWKHNFRVSVNSNRIEQELTDGTFKDTRVDWSVNQYSAFALTDHWSIGTRFESRRMERYNQKIRFELTPAIQYSVFPYPEATRRAFTFSYLVGPAYREYFEETIWGKLEETRWEQAAELEFSQRQTWGDASLEAKASHFLHDIDRHNVSLSANADIRITRGLNLNLRANASWVDDQIWLPGEGITDEEALLNLQAQATDYRYGFDIGLSFQFGSIFNNVVNNRFRGTEGFSSRGR